jgi:hypothetical protein
VQLPQLIRIRWAVRATLFLGVAASVAANVLHADPNIISQMISAWPPLALLLTVELTSRIPMHRPLLATVRVVSTAVIAGIAAWVSYWHMADVASRYGEEGVSAYLLPVSVDGLIVVASVSLVELAGRIRMLTDAEKAAPSAQQQVPLVAPAPVVAPTYARQAVAPAPAPVAMIEEETDFDAELAELEEESTPLSAGGAAHGSVRTPRSAPVSPAVAPVLAGAAAGSSRAGTRAAVSAPPRTVVTESTTPRQRRPASETAQLADAIEAMQPGIREEELASRLNISVSRLRQVRREEAARRAALPQ